MNPQPVARAQQSARIYAILSLVLILVILQLWLLTATMNAFLGDDEAVIWPAALVSLACFACCAYLIRTITWMERAAR